MLHLIFLFVLFKASVLARNLDLGTAHTTKSLEYAQRLLKIKIQMMLKRISGLVWFV